MRDGKKEKPTTIDAYQTAAHDEQLVGRDVLREDHGQRGGDAHHVVNEQAALAAKLVGYPAADKAADHAADGEY